MNDPELSKNELVHMCLESGIPAHKGMPYDELFTLAMDEPDDDPSSDFLLQAHRLQCELAIAFVPGVVINDCTTVCSRCSEAETVSCYIDNSDDMKFVVFSQGDIMGWTKKKLEEKTEQQLRGLGRQDPLNIQRRDMSMKSKADLIDLILARQAEVKTIAGVAPEEEPEPEVAVENAIEETAPEVAEEAAVTADGDDGGTDEDPEPPEEQETGTAAAVRERVKNLQKAGGAPAAAAAAAAKAATAPKAAAPAAPKPAAKAPKAAAPVATAPAVTERAGDDVGEELLDVLASFVQSLGCGDGGGAPVDLSEVDEKLEKLKTFVIALDKRAKELEAWREKLSKNLTLRLEQIETAVCLFAGFFYPDYKDTDAGPFETVPEVLEYCSDVLAEMGLKIPE